MLLTDAATAADAASVCSGAAASAGSGASNPLCLVPFHVAAGDLGDASACSSLTEQMRRQYIYCVIGSGKHVQATFLEASWRSFHSQMVCCLFLAQLFLSLTVPTHGRCWQCLLASLLLLLFLQSLQTLQRANLPAVTTQSCAGDESCSISVISHEARCSASW